MSRIISCLRVEEQTQCKRTTNEGILNSAHLQGGSFLRVESEEALEEILAVGGHVEWHPVLASNDLLAEFLKYERNKSSNEWQRHPLHSGIPQDNQMRMWESMWLRMWMRRCDARGEEQEGPAERAQRIRNNRHKRHKGRRARGWERVSVRGGWSRRRAGCQRRACRG